MALDVMVYDYPYSRFRVLQRSVFAIRLAAETWHHSSCAEQCDEIWVDVQTVLPCEDLVKPVTWAASEKHLKGC